ncbi:hypothetical protein PPTG_23093 [Phytophthora nicotianae INRA-310]|uniref:Uncharacterized protein n=1 Tax=Phytophthora nicotianae (strain INRA-310) TaxID=761204 RepID=W2Q5R9_PHYN3|nr:hypothetical protein PPTG_23093 [Phytophthora nicotianae INRA-310]ETN07879.1 hypothetical protein PPTG_23093 [Phytophthora nicotianae INRA-310]
MSANDAASTANARSTSHCEFGVAMCFSHREDARDPLPWVRVHVSLSCWPARDTDKHEAVSAWFLRLTSDDNDVSSLAFLTAITDAVDRF